MNPAQSPIFATTRWTLVLEAGRSESPNATDALAELCRTYWYPLYAHARKIGLDPHSAEDITQAFFGKLLEKNYLSIADQRRGRFRWFLLTAFKAFLANDYDRSQTQKRGGGAQIFSLDGLLADERYSHEPQDSALTAEVLFDKRWAENLIARTRAELERENLEAGRVARFNALAQFLPGEEPLQPQADVAAALGLSENAVKQEIFRLRRRFADLLRNAVAETVADPAEVDDEIRYLIDVVCRR